MANGPGDQIPPRPSQRPVRAERTSRGNWVFRDPNSGRFISRREGIKRLSFDPETNRIVDSRGKTVGPGALVMRQGGESLRFRNALVKYDKLTQSLGSYEIAPNEQFVERLTVRTIEGRVEIVEITHGKGQQLVIEPGMPQAKRWGGALREAAGVGRNAQVTTQELKEFVLNREVVVAKTTYR